jgi:bacterioferritin-associated ferredoxin
VFHVVPHVRYSIFALLVDREERSHELATLSPRYELMSHDRYQRRSGLAEKRLQSSQSRGFSGLDPSTVGLHMPDWLEPPSTYAANTSASPSCTPEAGQTPSRTMLEGMKVVCICKGITQRVFWKALDAGMRTQEDVNHFTGSGSGGCQGRRCGPRIAEMLRNLSA